MTKKKQFFGFLLCLSLFYILLARIIVAHVRDDHLSTVSEWREDLDSISESLPDLDRLPRCTSRGIECDLALSLSNDRYSVEWERDASLVSCIRLRSKYYCSTLSDILTSCWYTDTYGREKVGIGYGRYGTHDS
jgi:hypothetical protein